MVVVGVCSFVANSLASSSFSSSSTSIGIDGGGVEGVSSDGGVRYRLRDKMASN